MFLVIYTAGRCFHEIFRLFIFHCFMELFVYFLSVFTPYVAAFLLNEPGYNAPPAPTENYGDDPIVIVDLVGKKNAEKLFIICCILCIRIHVVFWFFISCNFNFFPMNALVYLVSMHKMKNENNHVSFLMHKI